MGRNQGSGSIDAVDKCVYQNRTARGERLKSRGRKTGHPDDILPTVLMYVLYIHSFRSVARQTRRHLIAEYTIICPVLVQETGRTSFSVVAGRKYDG